MSVILAAFVLNSQVKSPFFTQNYPSCICRYRYINTHVYINFGLCNLLYVAFCSNLSVVARCSHSVPAPMLKTTANELILMARVMSIADLLCDGASNPMLGALSCGLHYFFLGTRTKGLI